jgi:ABC-type glutathione transport system ATPase component
MPQKNYAFRMSTKANILLNGNDTARAEALMDAVQIRHLENKRADKLSGGETARMALARLMMKKYDLVVLDEPTAAMDMETTLLSEKLITEYVKETGCSLILVTHSLQQARRIADEVWYFHKGTLLETGPREQVLYDPAKPETRQFLEFYGV